MIEVVPHSCAERHVEHLSVGVDHGEHALDGFGGGWEVFFRGEAL
jgi:hypothetical protein